MFCLYRFSFFLCSVVVQYNLRSVRNKQVCQKLGGITNTQLSSRILNHFYRTLTFSIFLFNYTSKRQFQKFEEDVTLIFFSVSSLMYWIFLLSFFFSSRKKRCTEDEKHLERWKFHTRNFVEGLQLDSVKLMDRRANDILWQPFLEKNI